MLSPRRNLPPDLSLPNTKPRQCLMFDGWCGTSFGFQNLDLAGMLSQTPHRPKKILSHHLHTTLVHMHILAFSEEFKGDLIV